MRREITNQQTNKTKTEKKRKLKKKERKKENLPLNDHSLIVVPAFTSETAALITLDTIHHTSLRFVLQF